MKVFLNSREMYPVYEFVETNESTDHPQVIEVDELTLRRWNEAREAHEIAIGEIEAEYSRQFVMPR